MAKGGKGGDGGAADQAARQEQQRQQQVQSGTGAINASFDTQFTPEYFNKLKATYLENVNPQLDDQYAKSQRDLTFALARDGNLDSSARGTQFADLQKKYDANRLTLAGQAETQARSARDAVEAARRGLITQLNTTGDATGTASSAAAQAQALATPTAYSPLPDMFAAATGALGTQARLERNQALYGAGGGAYNTGLFG